jgi:hypothetical protein
MAILKNERIFDLAYGAKYEMFEIANIMGITVPEVEAVLANLSNGPSSQVSPGAGVESSPGGVSAQLLGGYKQVGNASRYGRSNADYLGWGPTIKQLTAVATEYGVSAPVPVRTGDVITKVGVFAISASKTANITHQQAALYEGKGAEPALLAESTDALKTEIAANSVYFWTLKTPLTITEANAPNGFIYANYVLVSTELPELLGQVVKKDVSNSVSGLTIAGHEPPLFLGASNKPAATQGEKAENPLKTTLAVLEKLPYFLLV